MIRQLLKKMRFLKDPENDVKPLKYTAAEYLEMWGYGHIAQAVFEFESGAVFRAGATWYEKGGVLLTAVDEDWSDILPVEGHMAEFPDDEYAMSVVLVLAPHVSCKVGKDHRDWFYANPAALNEWVAQTQLPQSV